MFDFEVKNTYKLQNIQMSNFLDPDTYEIIYFSNFGVIVDQIVAYDFNMYIECKAYFPNMYMQMEAKSYWGYANLYELAMMQKPQHTLGISNDDGSKLVVNFNLEYGLNESKL